LDLDFVLVLDLGLVLLPRPHSLEPRQSPGFVDITVKNRKRKVFPTQGRLNMKIRGSEVKANEKRQGSFGDNFGGTLNLININKGADAEPIGTALLACLFWLL
jgi:hypothetical protein